MGIRGLLGSFLFFLLKLFAHIFTFVNPKVAVPTLHEFFRKTYVHLQVDVYDAGMD